MTYERLILAVDEVAPDLSNTGYKLLWRLIASAIHSGRPDVSPSVRQLATNLKLSKDSIATAIRELAQYIRVEARDGDGTTFFLPIEWFPPQRTLFTDDELSGKLCERPGFQDGSVLFSRTVASQFPGRQRPGFQDGQAADSSERPGFQDGSVLISRTQRPNFQDAEHQDDDMGTRARVDRSIDPIEGQTDVFVRVDRAVQTVEILPHQREDAELLRSTLIDYRDSFPGKSRMNAAPDDVVIAHCLAIADVEQLCCVLRTLLAATVAPGHSDMWFFFTFADKVLGAPRQLVHDRMAAQKSKARSYKNPPGLFEAQLLDEVKGKLRRIG